MASKKEIRYIQIAIIILHTVRLVFLIFLIKYCLKEGLERPGDGTPLNVMAMICDQRHQTSVNKEYYWLASTLLRLTAQTRLHDW